MFVGTSLSTFLNTPTCGMPMPPSRPPESTAEGTVVLTGCPQERPSHASVATVMALTPVSRVDWTMGAKHGLWLTGMSRVTVPFSAFSAYLGGEPQRLRVRPLAVAQCPGVLTDPGQRRAPFGGHRS
jgi:hypothetical protein